MLNVRVFGKCVVHATHVVDVKRLGAPSALYLVFSRIFFTIMTPPRPPDLVLTGLFSEEGFAFGPPGLVSTVFLS